jgi:hypothetical protein
MNMLLRAWEIVRKGLIAVGMVLGVINTFILLTLVYVVIIGPIKIVFLLLRYDPLARSLRATGTAWRTKERLMSDEEALHRQF